MYSLSKREDAAHEDAIWAVDWYRPNDSIEGSKLITGSVDASVKIWRYDKDELKLEKSLATDSLGVLSVVVDPWGTMFASSSLNSNISIWDMETLEKKLIINCDALESWTVAFTQDSKFILSGTAEGKVEMFDVDTGKREKSLKTRLGGMAQSLATSPDGQWIACGGSNGLVAVLESPTGNCFKTLEGHTKPVRALAFSPDSQLFLTASDDKFVKIYDLTEFEVVRTMSGHTSWVLGVAFSPDGTQFASCSSDKSVRIWDVATKRSTHVFSDAHTDQVWSVVWGSNSKLASVGDDSAINVYNVIV